MNSTGGDGQELLRRIPRVDTLVELSSGREAAGGPVLLAAVRAVVDALRDSIIAGEPVSESDLEVESVVDAVLEEVKRMTEPTLKRVINATGVVLHTNLGRSPLSKRALKAVTDTSTGYCNLEYRLGSGERASRQEHVGLLERLTGAEAGFVVNNNAAAVLLCLTALASGREVVVSRGQLVEIGDSFRLPDIMRESGAKLVEVGTTNITRASDFANAIGEDTALLMRVHESNYRMVGYASQVPLEELVEVGRAHSVPVVEDLGSGSLIDLTPFGLPGEPVVSESVSKGPRYVQRRQAPGRAAGRHHSGRRPVRRGTEVASAGQGAAGGQDDAGGARGHAHRLPRRGEGHRQAALLEDAHRV